MGNIEPRHIVDKPRPERIAVVNLSGCEFVVGWDGEPGEPDTHCEGYVSVRGSKPTAWVECVNLGGQWWDAHEVFSSDFCDQLDAAICALEEFGSCA